MRRPDIKQRALFVTCSASWRGNEMLVAERKEESPLAAIVVATEQRARWGSGCHPPNVDSGTGKNACLFRLPASFRGIARLWEFRPLSIYPT